MSSNNEAQGADDVWALVIREAEARGDPPEMLELRRGEADPMGPPLESLVLPVDAARRASVRVVEEAVAAMRLHSARPVPVKSRPPRRRKWKVLR